MMEGTTMDIENVIEAAFAAAILNAPRDAARSRGTQTVPDIIDGERADLWHTLPERAAKIIARYVRYDADGRPWPRVDGSNVVVL
jgi:hypothetical protein